MDEATFRVLPSGRLWKQGRVVGHSNRQKWTFMVHERPTAGRNVAAPVALRRCPSIAVASLSSSVIVVRRHCRVVLTRVTCRQVDEKLLSRFFRRRWFMPSGHCLSVHPATAVDFRIRVRCSGPCQSGVRLQCHQPRDVINNTTRHLRHPHVRDVLGHVVRLPVGCQRNATTDPNLFMRCVCYSQPGVFFTEIDTFFQIVHSCSEDNASTASSCSTGSQRSFDRFERWLHRSAVRVAPVHVVDIKRTGRFHFSDVSVLRRTRTKPWRRHVAVRLQFKGVEDFPLWCVPRLQLQTLLVGEQSNSTIQGVLHLEKHPLQVGHLERFIHRANFFVPGEGAECNRWMLTRAGSAQTHRQKHQQRWQSHSWSTFQDLRRFTGSNCQERLTNIAFVSDDFPVERALPISSYKSRSAWWHSRESQW